MKFDESTHTYADDSGRSIPGVTSMIEAAGLYDSDCFDESAALRGTTVHVATAMYDRGVPIADGRLAKEYQPYLDAWIDFRETTKFAIQLVEVPVQSKVWGFAGMLDRTGRMDGGPLTLVDIKTGAVQAWHRIQTAAYGLAFSEPIGPCPNRMCVYLSGDGKWKMDSHESDDDAMVFRAIATLNQWKENNL